MPILTLAQIAAAVDGRLEGPDLTIRGLASLREAGEGELTFIGDQAHADRWKDAKASAALVSTALALEPGAGRALVRVANADLAMAQVLALFAPPPVRPPAGIDRTAVVDATARVEASAHVGALCFVGPHAEIGAGVILHSGVHVHAHSRIGEHSEIWSGTVIRERCTIGRRCLLHPNVSIGSDGFGFRLDAATAERVWVKVPHIGTVEIGDDVELGSGVCVDRGKFTATVIGCGVKIDNLVQVAHNCRIGDHCVIAGQSGLAGSVTLGHHVLVGGHVSIRDHVTVGDGARLAGAAAVLNDVPAGAHVGGYPAQDMRAALREAAAVRKLPDLVKLLKKKGTGG